MLRFACVPALSALVATVLASFRRRAALQVEILALRHQLGVLQRSVKRPKLYTTDRILWVWLSSVWSEWRSRVFQVLYVFLVLAHDRRRILHFAVTAHPTAEWTIQQLREAFHWDTAPQYLLRDRDRIFGKEFVDQVTAMGIKQVLSAPRSPWQRAYVERVIGTIRRECLDHVIVFNKRSLYRHLRDFIEYYHRTRTHLGL